MACNLPKWRDHVEKIASALSQKSIAISVQDAGRNIDILAAPEDYLRYLQDGLETAAKQVYIASLYCGVGSGVEAAFLTSLCSSIRKPQVQSLIILDALRGTRPTKNAAGGVSSSASELAKTVNEQSQTALFHTPALRGVLKRVLPPRVNEIVGVSHIKSYMFDDTLLMSGANLSSDYFTKRQDRYFKFSSTPDILQWSTSLLEAVMKHSYRLTPRGSLGPCPVGLDPLKQPNAFSKALKDSLLRLTTTAMNHQRSSSGVLFRDTNVDTCGNSNLDNQVDNTGPDTWVFPSVQLGSAGIRQDEEMTTEFIGAACPGSTIVMSSPYLNLAESYKRALAEASQVNIELLTASASANGFFGAKGAAGFIPTAYFLLQRTTWRSLVRAWSRGRQTSHVKRKLLEYSRPGWQFHAKGIWYIPPGETMPIACSIGSPNFGYRSVQRDLESQLFLVTTNTELRKKMSAELQRLKEHVVDVSDMHLKPLKGISYRARMAARLMRSFL